VVIDAPGYSPRFPPTARRPSSAVPPRASTRCAPRRT